MSSKKESFDFEKYSKEIQEAKNIEKIFEIIETVDKIENMHESEKGSLLVVAEKWITEHFNFNNFCEKADSIIKESQEGGIAFDAAINSIDKFSKFQERLYKYNVSNGLTHENKDMKSLIEQIQAITGLSIKAKDRLLEFAKADENVVSFKTAEDYAKEEVENKIENLKAKVERLREKLLNESNLSKIKRIDKDIESLKKRIKSLYERVDQEIAIRQREEEYEEKIKDLDSKKEGALRQKIQRMITNNNKIDASEASIDKKSKYDFDSPDFMFRNEVIKMGGLDNFIEYLENSGNDDFKKAAKTIKEVEIEKKNLETYYSEEKEINGINIEGEHRKAVKEAKREKNKLIKKEKGNIFSKIVNFFKSVGQGIRNYFDEKKAEKAEVSNFYEQRAQKKVEDIKAKYRVDIESWEVADQIGSGPNAQVQGDDEPQQ